MLSYEKVHSESSQDGWGECSLCNGPKSCFLIKSENGEKSSFGLFCINKHRCSEIDFIFKFLYLYVYVFGVCIHICGGQRSMCMYDMCVVCVCIHMCGAHGRMCMHGYVYGIHIYTCGGRGRC